MSQRSTSPPARRAAYRARVRAAVQRRSGPTPPRRAATSRAANAKPPSARDRRRMLQLLFSGMVLVVAIAVKLLMPDVLDRYRTCLLDLLGTDTDFVEVFSAAGRAFSEEGTIGGALNDAYTAVFGPSVPSEAPAQTAAVYTPEVQPANTDLLQQVLGFRLRPAGGGAALLWLRPAHRPAGGGQPLPLRAGHRRGGGRGGVRLRRRHRHCRGGEQ